MNGAQALVRTLIDSDVQVCFANPGTSEMRGYGRIGPGLANGIANLHNARRAHTPVVNIVGDRATGHRAVGSLAGIGYRRAHRQPTRRSTPTALPQL
jgi:acetolactate synthase I/II/III large subunit